MALVSLLVAAGMVLAAYLAYGRLAEVQNDDAD